MKATARQRRLIRRRPSRGRHTHSKAHCLKILRQLSAYLDDELPRNLCDQIRRHLGMCLKCEIFLESLKQTIALCRHSATRPLPPGIKARVRRQILHVTSRH